MILVERHVIQGNDEIVRLCKVSKELYNKCNYYMRKQWFYNLKNNDWNIPLPDINKLKTLVRQESSFNDLHNTKTAMQTVRQILNDWSNFRKALNAYNKNSSKFTNKPRAPKYKEKLAQVIFYNETIKGGRSKNKKNYIEPTNNLFFIKSDKEYKQVRITPKTFGFIIEVQYEKETTKAKTKKDNICNIDLGVNNLCAITSNQMSPILINGRIVKSINQYYNKYPTKKNSKKRYFRLENYFHHTSKFIIDLCVKHQISKIIIGKNNGWKQRSKLSKNTNQKFQYIPFDKLIQKINYKAQLVGIEIIFTEEAYTSQASFIDRDSLPEYKEGISHTFSGKRIKRGLYISKENRIINADVNGSANIGRKVIQNTKILSQLDRSLAARPELINPLNISM